MSLCGLRKSKRQKRDRSPPYSSEAVGEITEHKGRIDKSNAQVTKLDDEVKGYEKKYQDSTALVKKYEEELKTVKTELADLKDKAGEKVKEGSTSVDERISAEIKALKAKLEETEKKATEAESRGRELEAEKLKLVDELEKAKSTIGATANATKLEGETTINKLQEELKQTKHQVENEIALRTKAEEEKEKLKREKDVIENTLALTKKELQIAKKESHIPRSPTRAPSDEWKAKIENAEAELEKERKQRLEKEKENSRLNNDKDLLEKEKEELKTKIELMVASQKDELENAKKNLEMNHKNDIKRMEEKMAEVEETKDKLLNRLSAITAAHVLDNNPNVVDLNDPNRPKKLAENFSQVYDNEWTDATEELEKLNYTEDEMVKLLLDLLTNIYSHCKEAAENQMSRIEEDLFLPPMESSTTSGNHDTNDMEPIKSPTSSKQSMSKIPRFTSHKGRPALPNVSTEKKTVDNSTPGAKGKDNSSKRQNSLSKIKGEKLPEVPVEVRKGIKEYRKRIMKQVWPVIEKEILSKLRSSDEFNEKVIDACMPFINKCVELCWYMRVQDPPVALAWDVPSDKAFNKDMYRAYIKSGPIVEYVVWPTMYLYEGGPTLIKGVAQGCKE